MIKNTVIFGAVRKANDSEDEYVLPEEMASLREMVHSTVNMNAKNLPGWHNANPVVRVARFVLNET